MSVVRSLTGAVPPTQLVPVAHVMVPPPARSGGFQSMTVAWAVERASREAAAEYWRVLPRRETRLRSWFFRLVFIMDLMEL